MLFPQGILAWAKTAHPEIDPEDERLWWVPRFIGVGFVLMSIGIVINWMRSGPAS